MSSVSSAKQLGFPCGIVQTMKKREHDKLVTGSPYRFANWPIDAVPKIAAGVYTVWQGKKLLYVGMAGRGLSRSDVKSKRKSSRPRPSGLFNRLKSHASGRRSGDQFCVYVCDRFVVPTLIKKEREALSRGQPLLDGKTREWMRSNCRFRFVETADGKAALKLEDEIQRGVLRCGPPLLNGKGST